MTVDRPAVKAMTYSAGGLSLRDYDLVAWYPTLQPELAIIYLTYRMSGCRPWDRFRVDLCAGAAWSEVDDDWATSDQARVVIETLNKAFPGIGEMPKWASHLCDVLSVWVERRAEPVHDSWLPDEEVSA